MTNRTFRDGLADPIDRHVGVRIRLRRKELGLTQGELADSLGLTFQQVQKYERAANRVSASKLWEIARALGAPVSYFYDGADAPKAAGVSTKEHALLLSREGVELVNAFRSIKSAKRRRILLELIEDLATHGSGRREE